jgi:hypothetical protein
VTTMSLPRRTRSRSRRERTNILNNPPWDEILDLKSQN